MHDPDYVRRFYDLYGTSEWLRFEDSAYGRLQAAIHSDFVRGYVRSNDRVLDAGCGPGRFSLLMAEQGAKVTLLDISAKQLSLARDTLSKAARLGNVQDFIEADITDPGCRLDTGSFDVVVGFGGVLTYTSARRLDAVHALMRFCKPDGIILVSVPSRYGVAATVVRRAATSVLDRADENHLWRIVDEGRLPAWKSVRIGLDHPPMHLYSSNDLVETFSGCELLKMAGCPVTGFEGQATLDELASDPSRWATLLKLERRLGSVPGLVDSGTYIVAAFRNRGFAEGHSL